MEIKATDIRVCEQGLLTHQPITICESGVLIKFQGAKPRDITLCGRKYMYHQRKW